MPSNGFLRGPNIETKQNKVSAEESYVSLLVPLIMIWLCRCCLDDVHGEECLVHGLCVDQPAPGCTVQ